MYEIELLEIAKRHLNQIMRFNPYRNFPAIRNRQEFQNLIGNDPAFKDLGLSDEKYVIARLGGNLITSLHRKIGDMYEEMFQFLIQKRFSLDDEDISFGVDVRIGNRIQRRSTDGIVGIDKLLSEKIDVTKLIPSIKIGWKKSRGLGFEVRSCYQIGDSKRIQADYDMALVLEQQGFIPVMLIFCNTSLRSPVARLKNSWNLLQGIETEVVRFFRQKKPFE
jgi:hypothetical protein